MITQMSVSYAKNFILKTSTACIVKTFDYYGIKIPSVIILTLLSMLAMLLRSEHSRRVLLTALINSRRTLYSRRLLTEFRKLRFPTPSVPGGGNHAHPYMAALRRDATNRITDFINKPCILSEYRSRLELFLTPLFPCVRRIFAKFDRGIMSKYKRYDVSISNRELKRGDAGSRLIYDESDLTQSTVYGQCGQNDIITMIDVDFHLPSFNKISHLPKILYTRIPTAISNETGEGLYTLDHRREGVKLTEYVDGGAVWQSGLWDYSHDRVVVTGAHGMSFTIHSVEKIEQQGSQGRFVVGLIPMVRIWMPYGLMKFLAKILFLDIGKLYPELSHANNIWCDGPFTLGRFQRKKGNKHVDEVDIRLTGCQDATHATLPFTTYEILTRDVELDSKAAGLATMEHMIGKLGKQTIPQIKLWQDYFRVGHGHIREPLRLNYIVNDDTFEEGKAAAEIAVEPIAGNGVVATDALANDVSTVKKRIIAVQNNIEPPAKYEDYSCEFVSWMEPAEKLLPDNIQEIVDGQTRPNQRMRNAIFERQGHGRKAQVKAFQKKEVTTKAASGRNITTVQTEDTINLGTFIAPIKRYMQSNFRFFMPCKTPVAMANSVRQYCKSRDKIVETDYSKFDGTISPFLRKVERDCVLSFYSPQYHEELNEWLGRDQNLKGTTKHGVRYKTGSSRLSGSQLTTVGNTLINAFVAYCAYRNKGYSVKASRKMIGPKFGDDGLDDINGAFSETANDLGLKLKELVRDTERYVMFCGRYYLRPRTSNTSVFNPVKALLSLPVKLHGKDHKSKVKGYLATDPQTPLISNYCNAITRCYRYDLSQAELDREDEFTVKAGPYPFDENDRGLAVSVIAELIGLDDSTLNALMHELDSCVGPQQLHRLGNSAIFPKSLVEVAPDVRFVEGTECLRSGAIGLTVVKERRCSDSSEQTN